MRGTLRIRSSRQGAAIPMAALATIVVVVIIVAALLVLTARNPLGAMNHATGTPVAWARADGLYSVSSFAGNAAGKFDRVDVTVMNAAPQTGGPILTLCFICNKVKTWVLTTVEGPGASVANWQSPINYVEFGLLDQAVGSGKQFSFASGVAEFNAHGDARWTFTLQFQQEGGPVQTVATMTKTVSV